MVECDPEPASRPEWVLKFCKSEGDFTGEMGAGQFSIFGAIEEKDVHGILAIREQGTRLSDVGFLNG
jgi:hypothetical protein